jgi:hypothetical protein
VCSNESRQRRSTKSRRKLAHLRSTLVIEAYNAWVNRVGERSRSWLHLNRLVGTPDLLMGSTGLPSRRLGLRGDE